MENNISNISLQRKLADSVCRLAALDDLRLLLAGGARVNEPVTMGLRPLHYACWQNYVDAVKFLLVRGSDIDATDDVGYSALHLSAEHGHLQIVRILLGNGAKVNFRGQNEKSCPEGVEDPLHLAIKNGHYEIAKLLLENGADPNARYFMGSQINLVSVANLRFIELLLNFGANPDSRDRNGLTPLMKAARLPNGFESVLLLVSYGADINAMTNERNDNRTVLHYAILGGNTCTICYLLKQGARVVFDDSYIKPTPLDLAILKGSPILVKLLIDKGADVNKSSSIVGTPLQIACADNIGGRLEILHLLLMKGADSNPLVYSDDGVPLRPPLSEYLSSNDNIEKEIVQLLLKFGAKVIMTSSFKDYRGIFHTLVKLKDKPDVFVTLLNAAEKFDIFLTKRNTVITNFQRELILQRALFPLPLMHQVRLYFRRLWKLKIFGKLEQLPLPHFLKKYLLYEVK